MEPSRRELNSRRNDNIEVVISWVQSTNLCLLTLTELDNNRTLEFAVEPDDLVEAFEHPYYFASLQGCEFTDII